MIRKTDEVNKQIAELEYKNYEINELIKTEQGFKVGRVLDVNDNRSGNGEQIYAIASDGSNVSPNAPLSERAKVKEITLLYRGSTNPLGLFTGKAGEVGRDWVGNNAALRLKMLMNQRGVTGH